MKENATEIDLFKRLESDIRSAAKPTEDADQLLDTVVKHNIPCLVVNSDSVLKNEGLDIVVNHNFPCLVFNSGSVLKNEGDESIASGYYVDPLDPSKSFNFTGATIMKVKKTNIFKRKDLRVKLSNVPKTTD